MIQGYPQHTVIMWDKLKSKFNCKALDPQERELPSPLPFDPSLKMLNPYHNLISMFKIKTEFLMSKRF